MKTTSLIALLLVTTLAAAQPTIDLKTLIGKSSEFAEQKLKNWGLAVTPSTKYDHLWVGYNDGLQIEIKNDTVNTIWVETPFNLPIDGVTKLNGDIRDVIKTLGRPDEKEDGFTNIEKGVGWVKWNTSAYQLHCHVNDARITMVTIMEPDWYPGKD